MTMTESRYFPGINASTVTRTSSPCRRRSTGFTLIELMISIALALVLILGVNQVFTYTTKAVGAGEAINSVIRLNRAFGTAISNDMASIVPNGANPTDSACLIIGSQPVYAYRNAADLAAQGTPSVNAPSGLPNAAFIDLNGDGKFGDPSVPGEVVWPCVYNFRNHRIDCLSFFARDTFHRQTGNLGTFVDNMASNEAWIWYGHLWLPDNNNSYPSGTYSSTGVFPPAYPINATGPLTLPGAGALATNPNNYFASQFVLGRQAILLREKSVDGSSGAIYDNSGYVQRFIDRINSYTSGTATPPTYAKELDPLVSSSQAPYNSYPATYTGDTTSWYLQDGRFDLAATTIYNFRNKLNNYLDSNNSGVNSSLPYWWDWMMDGNISPPISARPFPTNAYTRFKCNPFVGKPMDAAAMAQAQPYMVSGCSQFIVEFAGDFVTQDNDSTHVDAYGAPFVGYSPNQHTRYGDIIATTPSQTSPTVVNAASAPDGQIDFTIVNVGTATNPRYVKQIKWYGMPRGTAGQSSVAYYNGDVVPLRDWLKQAVDSKPNSSPPSDPILAANFEKYYPVYPTSNSGDYTGTNGLSLADAQKGYTVAFGPNDPKPKLIRITMTLEDPTGRLPDGQTYQYVFQIP